MKIRNRTRWSSDDLRYLIGQAFAAHGVPSTGVQVFVNPRRQRGFVSSRSQGGTFKATFVRRAGASLVRGPVKCEYGTRLTIVIRNPATPFDPESEEHTGNVVELARCLDAEAVHMAAGTVSRTWYEKPIKWLSDWFEVHRGKRGRIAGARVTPLLPEAVELVDRRKECEREIARVSVLLKKARTRKKRAETSEKKHMRKLASLERKLSRESW